jgi:transmembrane sensor
MKSSEKIGLLMYRFMINEITPKQRKELLAWRNQSAKHETAFQEATDWQNVLADLQWSEYNSNAVLEKIKEKYPGLWQKEEEKTKAKVRLIRWLWQREEQKPKAKVRLMTRLWRAAAIIITFWMISDYQIALYANAKPHPGTYAGMVDGSGNIVLFHDLRRGIKAGKANLEIQEHDNGEIDYVATNNPKFPNTIYDLVTYRGNAFVLRLPGMGSIWVNASSSIWYPAKFDADTLRIKLIGEAYFEMAAGKPVVIEIPSITHYAGQAVNPASGGAGHQPSTFLRATGSFNVHAYPGDSLKIANDEQSAAWKNRVIYYKDASLKTILDEISRWYDVNVIYQGSIPDKKFNIRLSRNTEFSEVIRVLNEQGAKLQVSRKNIYLL